MVLLGVHAVRQSVKYSSEMSSWDMKGRIWFPLPVGHRWSVRVTSPSPPACAYVREEKFLPELCRGVRCFLGEENKEPRAECR